MAKSQIVLTANYCSSRNYVQKTGKRIFHPSFLIGLRPIFWSLKAEHIKKRIKKCKQNDVKLYSVTLKKTYTAGNSEKRCINPMLKKDAFADAKHKINSTRPYSSIYF